MGRDTIRIFLLLGLLAAWRPADSALAGGGPENVAVVINSDSWASKAVANEYIRLRRIPPENVVYLAGLSEFEQVTVEVFRRQILQPLLETLRQRGLQQQIDYVAYSSDLPYAIDVRSDLAGVKAPRVITPIGSINGLTYLYERVLAKDANYLALNSNGYMRRPLRQLARKPLPREDLKRLGEAAEGMKNQQWKQAEEILRELAGKHDQQAALHYNLACCLSRQMREDDALQALSQAVRAGWNNRKHTEADEDLAALRERDDFKKLMEQMDREADKPFDVQPTVAFDGQRRWNAGGELVKDGGSRYLLSTMLAVTSGRGNSLGEAIGSLRRSVLAEETPPSGAVYFMKNGNVRSKTREAAFRSAAEKLRQLGVQAHVDDGVLPQQKNDVMGAMIGTAAFDWKASGSTIKAGAICEHLTSFGGVMRESSGQTPLSEFIRHGAAGASGTVTEPFAIQAKFPLAFLHVHYARGCSLAESFYQSVQGPYQLLIVGDPLCQPWADRPKFSVDGLRAGQRVQDTVAVTARGDANQHIDRFELFVDGLRLQSCRPGEPFELDTTILADGHHEGRIVAVGGGASESQSRQLIPFVVDNAGRSVEFSSLSGDASEWGRPLRLAVRAKGAKAIEIRHNGRLLTTIGDQQADAEAEVDSRVLGQGPVTLSAVASYEDGQLAFSQPLQMTISPPSPREPHSSGVGDKWNDGLVLSVEGQKPHIIQNTREKKWLSELGLPKDAPYRLSGWFSVEADDVYQFQLRHDGEAKLLVDGHPLIESGTSTANGWKFLPVALARGPHAFELRSSTAHKPVLEIRFGGQGARSLDGKRFRHPAAE